MKRSFTETTNSSNENNNNNSNNSNKKHVDKSRLCPYLDTVNRNILDFDFEKVCSVTLTKSNTYACLVCGKYYQGRSKKTAAYSHSLEENHHVFINLRTKKIYCLPDDYEVIDPSLSDIQGMVDPQLKDSEIEKLDKELITGRTIDGKHHICGIVGLNNINLNDYFNCVIQALAHSSLFRNFFLKPENYSPDDRPPPSELIDRLGILIRKMWYPHNWRSHVSPHELLQEVAIRSQKKYRIGQRGDPFEFLIWFLNTLHLDFITAEQKYQIVSGAKTKKKVKKSIITELFQGKLRIIAEKQLSKKDSDSMNTEEKVERVVPFFFLHLDLPPTPLFKDEKEKFSIPQHSIYSLLAKYDGTTTHFVPQAKETRTYKIIKLPKYLIIYVNRFTRNNWYKEKNKSIVNFNVKNLDMSMYTENPKEPCLYDLVANIQHEGSPEEGTYKVYLHHKADNEWYQIQDMNVENIRQQEILAGTLHLSAEPYIQIYERQENV